MGKLECKNPKFIVCDAKRIYKKGKRGGIGARAEGELRDEFQREGGQEVGRIFRLPRLDRSLVPRQTLNIHYYDEIGARAHLDPSLLPITKKTGENAKVPTSNRKRALIVRFICYTWN